MGSRDDEGVNSTGLIPLRVGIAQGSGVFGMSILEMIWLS